MHLAPVQNDAATAICGVEKRAVRVVWFLIIGLAAGWIAGRLMKGRGFGLLGNLIVGVLGALMGGFLLGVLGVSAGGGLLGELFTSVLGAVVLLYLISFVPGR